MVTKAELQKMAKSGRTAIEYRLLGVLIRPRELTDADHKELEALKALMKQYDELMDIPRPQPETREGSNDGYGGQE